MNRALLRNIHGYTLFDPNLYSNELNQLSANSEIRRIESLIILYIRMWLLKKTLMCIDSILLKLFNLQMIKQHKLVCFKAISTYDNIFLLNIWNCGQYHLLLTFSIIRFCLHFQAWDNLIVFRRIRFYSSYVRDYIHIHYEFRWRSVHYAFIYIYLYI